MTFTKILAPGEIMTLEDESCWEASTKRLVNRIGIEYDRHIKELFAHYPGVVISGKFEPHDYFLEIFREIKTTSGDDGSSISISLAEKKFGELEISNGRDVIYEISCRTPNNRCQLIFAGYVSFKSMLDGNMIMLSDHKNGNGEDTFYVGYKNLIANLI
jgi:hypothetical protein